MTTCVLSIYNLKLDRDCGQHSNSQSTYLCVLLRNQNWLKIGQLTSIARALYFLSPNLETQWSKMFILFKMPIVLRSFVFGLLGIWIIFSEFYPEFLDTHFTQFFSRFNPNFIWIEFRCNENKVKIKSG